MISILAVWIVATYYVFMLHPPWLISFIYGIALGRETFVIIELLIKHWKRGK